MNGEENMIERLAFDAVAGGKGDKDEYMRFFKKKLEKYKVESPAELDKSKRKKFYDEVDAGWEADHEVGMAGIKMGRRSK
jgi:hypothetical protein